MHQFKTAVPIKAQGRTNLMEEYTTFQKTSLSCMYTFIHSRAKTPMYHGKQYIVDIQARLSVVSGPFQSDDKSNLSFQLLQQPFISMAHSNRKWNGGKKLSPVTRRKPMVKPSQKGVSFGLG